MLADEREDRAALYRRAQFDRAGSAAGSPPDFDGPTPGARPTPVVAPVATRERKLPRLGPGITPNAPKTDEGTDTPAAPVTLAEPILTSPRPILMATAEPSPTSAPIAARVDWRLVVWGSLALALVWFLLAGRDE